MKSERTSKYRRPTLAAALAVCVGLCAVPALHAQATPEVSTTFAVRIDSGAVAAPNVRVAQGSDPVMVFSTHVNVAHEAPWVRLNLAGTKLAGSVKTGNSSYLMITSVQDGAWQRLDGEHIEYWNYTSAYFNGNAVLVELWAYPGTGDNQLVIPEITAGDAVQPDSICGNVDDRTPFSDPRVAHLRPIGCTAWIAGHGLSANRFLTAGHCIAASTSNAVVMFGMPLSTSTGAWTTPAPEYQYPVQQASIQSSGDVGSGNDYATFQTFPNSNTGMVPRHAQREAIPLALSAPNVANPPQIIRITGHGSRDGTVTTPIPMEWNSIGKTHTGNYVLKSGNLIRYAVDTTGGNSGSPVILESTGNAIGIHTHAGCTSTGGSNQGTAIEHPTLQNFLSNALGTSIPYIVPPSLAIPFASNNQGSPGGAVYFDVAVGPAPLDIWGLDLNIGSSSTPGARYTVDVYITPQTRVGKETTSAAWTRVASGTGIVNPTNSVSRVVLPSSFRLVQGARYGVALVLSATAGHAYTNGDNNYSNANLTIEAGAASNVPWTGIIQSRTWNGRFSYTVAPVSGQCLETLYASNNSGSPGGAVYFDLRVYEGTPVRISAFNINTGSAAGTPLTMNVYRRPTTSVGQQTGAGWVQVGTATGTSAGTGNATRMTLNAPIFLTGNSVQGMALVLIGGNHAYTNGTGFNEVYTDSSLRISDGTATNVPFTAPVFDPRVFNGSICYTRSSGGCAAGQSFLTSQLFDETLDGRNSNTTEQQIADDFQFSSNANLVAVKTWATYTGTLAVPTAQNFTVNIYAHDVAANGPGTLLYSQNVNNVTPIRTGLAQTGFAPSRDLYEFNISLPGGFNAQANQRYWLSILGNNTGVVWAWQFSSTTSGTRRSRGSPTGIWSVFAGDMAFQFCGTVSAVCYANCDGSTTPPILNIDDFTCFINQFAAGQALPPAQQVTHYANCDGSTTAPVLNIDDFTCFINRFAQGCP